MPYYKVPVTVELSAYRYVEAEDKEEATMKALEQCDNTVPYINNWPDSEDPMGPNDEEAEVEEITEEEYEAEGED